MGRKATDKTGIDRCILGQQTAFTPEMISTQLGVSANTVYLRIRDLMAQTMVRLDHKDGHRMFYGVVSSSNKQTIVQNQKSILTLPPQERFQYVSHLTDMVINGISPSLLVTGLPGIGKTYIVRRQLNAAGFKEGDHFHFCSGHSSAMGLYSLLYSHSDSIIVFDDCDSVFGDSTSLNILKSALDSYSVRKVCWQSMRMPEGLEPEFNFTGQIIFISNKNAGEIDGAVKSRTIVVDLQMTRQEIVDYMRSIIEVLEPDVDMALKMEVLEYLGEVCTVFEQFNIRTFIKACRIRKAATKLMTDWKRMILVVT